MEFLDQRARAAAERVLAEEVARRSHLVVALSGAHAYGFPSPDSDLDLKAVHVEPTRRLLGLRHPKPAVDRLEVVDGVEIDYTSNEIAPVLGGILAGNGNYIERILGHLTCASSPAHEALKPLVRRALSRRVHRHYRGFATSQRQAFEEAEVPTVKKLLYVLRTTLTGTHLLRTGELRIDLTTVAHEYDFGHALELVETKRRGEQVALSTAERARWQGDLDRAFALLDQAHAHSALPPEPINADELEDWLVALRLGAGLGDGAR
jgi:predicted nucleotidyltransferase